MRHHLHFFGLDKIYVLIIAIQEVFLFFFSKPIYLLIFFYIFLLDLFVLLSVVDIRVHEGFYIVDVPAPKFAGLIIDSSGFGVSKYLVGFVELLKLLFGF